MRRRLSLVVLSAAVLLAATIAGCTSTKASNNASPPAQISSSGGTRPAPTAPVVAGPTSSATKACPLADQATVQDTIGQRLDHARVQVSGGKVVGCQFFPITVGLSASEHLPTGGYPSAKIVITQYQDLASALQALAATARAGVSPSQDKVGTFVAETFQNRFYPPDGRADWFCAFIKGSKLVTVAVAENTSQGQQIALDLAGVVAPKV